jgi:selenocysteine lyase/cysteine desulfurase
LKEGLAAMKHVTLHTPLSDELSAGIVCFMVEGMTPRQVVDRLAQKKIVASVSPYAVSYARLAPSLLVTPEQVDVVLREIRALA